MNSRRSRCASIAATVSGSRVWSRSGSSTSSALAVELAGEVPLAGVAQHGHHPAQLGMMLDHLLHGRDVDARGRAAQQPLLARQPPRGHQRLVGRDGHDAVHRGEVEVGRHDAVADARDPVGAPRVVGDERALRRFDRERQEIGVAGLERVRDAADPSAGALRAHDRVDPAARLLPDLLAARTLRLGVVGVLELAGEEVRARGPPPRSRASSRGRGRCRSPRPG